ncbi:AAA family ATPase [Staphylococcus haemolyticus]|uniref:TrlF family AAA-like ATPase n=1 Tax=Staphylococcus haemolyticus TaxID=1283 RepID=UPI0013749B19|nr:AAA family ATPase [Staphylococcus haemolyticus]QUX19721.1 AAA family ATPase [Staphylococcus haemolyticus]UCH99673.1 AAA family ATPase [Staphylococcus haemolyticus]UCI01890.1 AAA family ATPase [Staphylococcus haemolyticus]
MSKSYAKFYKCALQVNPYSYIKYRGLEHEMTEEQYNESIYHYCKTNDISIIGLADHGNVDKSSKLRQYLVSKGILVFPGFEISTSEKVHIVCLFSENTEERELERYLGELGLSNPEEGNSPSTLSFYEITQRVLDRGGFWYAAHVTSDNGILKGKHNNLWQSDKLIAAQIPSKKNEVDPKYTSILKNKDPNYQKQTPFALINAKDISKPEDLRLDTSSCLIKMSKLNFESFKLAFKDPDARVKLNSDINNKFPHSSIDKIKISMGYLDNLSLDLSSNLNTIIGGRGTGKSTLIELIRYALDIAPTSQNTNTSFENICKFNLGIGGKVELSVTSHAQYGKQFKIIKRYNEDPVVKDIDNNVSNYTVKDILPNIEVYSQNEIIDLTTNENAKLNILNRFLDKDDKSNDKKEKIKNNLHANSKSLIKAKEDLEKLHEKINQLPKLKEKLKHFNELGIGKKLEVQGKVSREEQYIQNIKQIIEDNDISITNIILPFNENYNQQIKHVEIFDSIKNITDNYNEKLTEIKSMFTDLKDTTQNEIENIYSDWKEKKKHIEKEINRAIRSLDDIEGKTKEDIAHEYTETQRQITSIEPLESQLSQVETHIETLEKERRQLKEDLKEIFDEQLKNLKRCVKKINNRYLKKQVNIKIQPYANVNNLIEFLKEENGLGDSTLKWIKNYQTFNLPKFIKLIKDRDREAIYEEYKDSGLKRNTADILSNMTYERILKLESIELENIIDIQLNVGSDKDTKFRSLNNLSKGQQCTAILNLLTLSNNDPLLVDQPEDNLDNSFITNNLVENIRKLKINRQFIFATHNANIPVFGDAELIVTMENENGQGSINNENLGSIDNTLVRNSVIQILEGGDAAFKMRKNKYGL